MLFWPGKCQKCFEQVGGIDILAREISEMF